MNKKIIKKNFIKKDTLYNGKTLHYKLKTTLISILLLKTRFFKIEFKVLNLKKNKNKIIRTSANFKYKEKPLDVSLDIKLNSFFLKKGKKLKTYSLLKKGFLYFFDDLVYNFENKTNNFKNIIFFLNALNYDSSIFNFNNLLSWVLKFNQYIYFFKTKKIPKFLKKKLKKKYIIENFLIKKNYRTKYTLKFVYFFILKNNNRNLKNKIFKNLQDIILNLKNSVFYKNKNIAFKKVINSFFKKFN